MKKPSYAERKTALRKAGYQTLTGTDCRSITRQLDGGYWIEGVKPLWSAKDHPVGWGMITGYYCDSFAEETYVPAVVRMGRRLFAGYLEPWNNGFRASPEVFLAGEMDRAKTAADSYTESAAEDAREYDERWQAARKLEEEIADLEKERAEEYREARAVVAEIRKSTLSHGLCGHLRDIVRRKVERARECLRQIAPLRESLAEYADVPA